MVALIWGLDIARESGHKTAPDCRRCSQIEDEDILAQWGCGCEAVEPVWSDTCGDCDGVGCDVCGGSGERGWRRCPQGVLAAEPMQAARVMAAMSAYQQLDARQTWPVAGGTLDQSESFWQFVQCADRARGGWERMRSEKGGDNGGQ
ncbi:MAG: hypothetical protein ACPGVG_19695 [Mycobacterium sp.]